MKEYYLNVSIRKAGGTAGKGAVRGSLNVPKEILNALKITQEDKEVILSYNSKTKEVTIKKAPKVAIL